MCKKEKFSCFIESTLQETLKTKSLKEAAEIACKCIAKYYQYTHIDFAETLGKRVSYIVGAGEETYNPSKTIAINEKYCIIIENFSEISVEEEESLVELFKRIIEKIY